MKKYLFLLLLLSSLLRTSTTHAQFWCWVKDTTLASEGGASQGAVTDLYGNAYSYAWGKYLLKHKTSDGSISWVKSGCGCVGWNCSKLITDNPGNVYMLYDSAASNDFKLSKIDSFGNTLWTTLGHTSSAGSYTAAIDRDNLGHLFICGSFLADYLTMGGDTLYNTLPKNNGFVARLDTAGNVKWIKSVSSPLFAKAISVAADRSGNVFIGGICKGDTLKILDSTVHLSLGGGVEGMFVAKCDSSGHLLWVRANRHISLGGGKYHIRVDDAGNAYFAGELRSTDTLGTIPLMYGTTDNVFMAKYRGADGTVLWAKTGGGTLPVFPYSMATNASGKSYLVFSSNGYTSHFGSSSFSLPPGPTSVNSTVVGLDSSGNVICSFMLGGNSGEDDIGIAVDAHGNSYVHGDYALSCSFGGITLTTPSPTDERYFLAKYTCNCLCDGTIDVGGGGAICVGNTTTLTSSGSGGTWTSTNPAVATISAAGIITAILPGTTVIGYITGGGCNGTAVLTVVATPAITGGSLCFVYGSATTLAATPSGGTWTSTTPVIATISPMGVVTGSLPGTSLISYVISAGCSTTAVVTVSGSPAVPPASAMLCAGTTLSLTGSIFGGTWTSSNTSAATVGISTGALAAVGAGTSTISYAISGNCPEITNVTVNAMPGPISGKPSICEGFNTLLSSTPTGGTWSSSASGVATVSSSGTYTGIAPGTTTMTYMLPGGCFSTYIVTVNALPSTITGPTTVTIGSSIVLNDATAGGSWSSGDVTKANVNSVGKVTGAAPGTVTIYYTLPTGCKQAVMINVVKSVSVTAVAKTAKPSLYPNPATNEMTVRAERSAFTSFTIYNAAGQEVATHEIVNQETTVNVKSFAPGEYQVILKGEGLKEVLRFMKW